MASAPGPSDPQILDDRIARHRGELLAFLRRRSPREAEELAQETWMRVARANPDCPDVELRPDSGTFTYAYKYGRSPGALDREYVRRVPMSRETVASETLESIRVSMPAVWRRMVRFSETSARCVGLPDVARIQIPTAER